MSKKPTGGPWMWWKDDSGRMYLGTPDRGRLIVMDFIRLGMADAAPRFAVWEGDVRGRMGGVMRRADTIEFNDHPDARLIAAAPRMYAAIASMAENGCADSIAILESINGS